MSEKNDQDTHYHELSGAEGRAKIAALVKGIHICMMTTARPDGQLSSRPMAVQNAPFDGVLWFLTRKGSEKVEEIVQDQHVMLNFAEPSDSKYISLRGRATVVPDSPETRKKIEELWNPMYQAWFPGGKEDPQIAVLRVDAAEADYWEASSSKVVMMAKYALAAVTHGSVPVGDAGHVTV